MRSTLLIILMSAILALAGCSNYTPDPRLKHIDNLTSENPHSAADSLLAINRSALSEADRHYYDLLTVKCADKAYITHTSDSLIRDVINWYEAHSNSQFYAEALYYAGRVYSDIGDYPTALRYFQDALDDKSEYLNPQLKGNLLSQTGRLLNRLRLFDDALPYLNEVLHIDSITNDTANLAYDHQLIGTIYLNTNNIDAAVENYEKAKEWASQISFSDSANMNLYLAATKLKSGETDHALRLIRGTMDLVTPMYKNICLAYASDIYLKAGIKDTAYTYALDLAQSTDLNNQKCGYANLLSPQLISMSQSDSLLVYIRKYRNILEEYYNRHESQQAIMQNSLYNYQVHERERQRIESENKKLTIWCLICVSIILLLLLILLVYHNHKKQSLIKQHETIARLDYYQKVISNGAFKLYSGEAIPPLSFDTTYLRNKLKEKINLLESSNQSIPVSQIILKSEAYFKLQNFIADKKVIADSNPLWEELETCILEASPDFKETIHQLVGGSVKLHDMHTIYLIKCGVTPSQQTCLLGLAKSSVSSRRESLSIKIMGEKISLKAIDNIIRLL